MSPSSNTTGSVARREMLRALAALSAAGLAGCSALDPDRTPSKPPPETASDTGSPTATESRCASGWDGAIRWTTGTVGEPTEPVVDGDAVLLVGDTGTATDVVYALDSASGESRWTRDLPSVGSLPTVGGGRLYLNHAGTLRALDVATGDDAWTTSLEAGSGFSTNPRFVPPRAAGTPSGGLLVVGVVRHDTAERRVENPFDRVYAYDAASGAERWFVDLPSMPEGLAVTDELVLAGTGRGTVHAVGTDGTERWRTDLGIEPCYGCLVAPPMVGSEAAFVVADEFLVAVALDDGTESWRQDGVRRPAVLGESGLYCKLRGEGGPQRIAAFDPLDGTQRWKTPVGGADEAVLGLGAGEATVYVSVETADSATALLAVDAVDGCTVGSRTIDGEPATAPVVGEDVVVVGSGDGSPSVSALGPRPTGRR